MGSILIRQATIVSSQNIFEGDVLIENGRFVEIKDKIEHNRAEEEIQAKGLHLLPGILDTHVHFRDPGSTWKEDIESGSRAAVAGGVTSFFDMPNTDPPTTTEKRMRLKKQEASEKSLANYNFLIGATPDNLNELNKTKNIPGIKIFMGSSTGSLLVYRAEDLENIFSNGTRLIAVHAENEERLIFNRKKYPSSQDVFDHLRIRDVETSVLATRQAISLSHRFQRRLHLLHLTTGDEVDILKFERRSAPITAEVCPQHFMFHAPEIYERLGTLAQMNPPLREKEHAEKLWQGLREGVIDCIVTDHAPHTLEEKKKPYGEAPSGLPGVETSLPIMLDRVNQNLCSLQEVVLWMCENPIRVYRIQNKGFIREGYDADCVLVDMKKKKTVENGHLYTKVNWSPYDGMSFQGWPVMTFVCGNLVFKEGVFFEETKGKVIKIEA